MTPEAPPEGHPNRYVRASKALWTDLVCMTIKYSKNVDGLAQALAQHTKANPKALRRKIYAIKSALSSGMPAQEIIDAGQTAILARDVKKREADKLEPEKTLRYRIPVTLAEAWHEDVERRLARVTKIRSHEHLVTFLHSLILGMADEDLKHHAGDIK